MQIIPNKRSFHLKMMYGCRLWKIYDVVKIEHKKSHGIKKEWKLYYIELTFICEYRRGEKYLMPMFEDEINVLTPYP